MAEQNDGSVRIDTDLDTSGFEKGSEKLKKAAEDTAKSIEGVGAKAGKSVEMPEIDTTDAAKKMEQDIHDAFAETFGKEHPQPIEDEDMSSKALEQATARLQKQIDGTMASLDKLSNASLQGFQSAGAVNTFNSKIEESRARVEAAKQALEEFSQAEIPTDQYSKLEASAQRAENTLENLREQQDFMQDTGVDENSKQWQALTAKIDEAQQKVYYYRARMESMRENGLAFVDPQQTEQFDQMTKELQEAEAALQRNAGLIDQEALAQGRLNVQVAQEKVATAGNAAARALAVRQLQNAQNQLAAITSEQTTPAPDPARATSWQRFAGTVSGVGAQIRASLGSIGSSARGVFGKISGVAHSALGRVGSLGKKAFDGLRSAIGSAAGRLKSFVGGANKSTLSVKNLVHGFMNIKQMLFSRIKRTFITNVFKDLQASIQALARFDGRFNEAMSNMKNRSSELSANVAVAFGSLVKTFEPIITKLLNTLSDAMTKVNAVFAALRGENTVTVAAQQTESYADSLEDAAHNAEKTKQQQEKLNATLSSFDEIHKLSSDSDGAGTDNSDKNADKTIYKTVPVNQILGDGSALSRIANMILGAFDTGYWAAVGSAIGNGINGIVDKLSAGIPLVREKAEKFAAGLADGLNGLVYAMDGSKIGGLFAGGVNLIFGTLNTFLRSFDFNATGRLISSTINGFFENVEWDTVAQTIINGFRGMLDFTRSLIGGLDWSVIGGAVNTMLGEFNTALTEYDFYGFGLTIGTKVTEAVQSINWGLAGQTLANGVNAVISGIHGIVDGIGWDALGLSLSDSINGFIETVNWAEAGQTLSDAVKGVLSWIATTLENIEWQELGNKVAEFIGTIDWTGIAEKLFEGIGAALGGLAAFLLGLVEKAMDSLTEWWYQNAYENGEFSISGLFEGISNALADIAIWVHDHIWVPFRDGFKKAFGISSPSKEMKPFGDYIIQGLFNGITGALKGVGNWIKEHIWEPIKSGLNRAFNVVSGAAGAVKSIGGSVIAGLKEGVSGGISTIGSWLKDNVTDKFVGKFMSLLGINSPSKVFAGIGGYVTEGFTNGLDSGWKDINGLLDAKSKGFVEAGKSLIDSLKSGVSATWDSLVSDMFTKMGNLTKWAEGRHFVNAGVQIVEGLKAGISSKWDSLVEDVWRKTNNLKNWFDDRQFYAAGWNIAQGLKQGIYDNWQDINWMCTELARGTVEMIRAEFDIHSPSRVMAEIGGYITAGLANGIEGGASGVFSTVSALTDNVLSGMEELYEVGNGEMFTGLDATAEQLAEIARALLLVDRAMPDFAAAGVPGIMLGMVAPPKTAGAADAPDSKVIRLLEELVSAMSSDDEPSAPQPIRLETKVMIDRREIGKAVSEYDLSNNRIRNGSLTGGSR